MYVQTYNRQHGGFPDEIGVPAWAYHSPLASVGFPIYLLLFVCFHLHLRLQLPIFYYFYLALLRVNGS
jgi:hypothetical protein